MLMPSGVHMKYCHANLHFLKFLSDVVCITELQIYNIVGFIRDFEIVVYKEIIHRRPQLLFRFDFFLC